MRIPRVLTQGRLLTSAPYEVARQVGGGPLAGHDVPANAELSAHESEVVVRREPSELIEVRSAKPNVIRGRPARTPDACARLPASEASKLEGGAADNARITASPRSAPRRGGASSAARYRLATGRVHPGRYGMRAVRYADEGRGGHSGVRRREAAAAWQSDRREHHGTADMLQVREQDHAPVLRPYEPAD
jgi:hypothetical protein